MLGEPGKPPQAPLNLLADFGGGGMMAVLGMLMALVERGISGKGQVVNVDMVTGSRYLSSFALLHAKAAEEAVVVPLAPSINQLWGEERGRNVLDNGAEGAPFCELLLLPSESPLINH